MPRHSDTGNARKFCDCQRAKSFTCSHPWYVDFTAAKTHPTRAGQRFRKNLDVLIGSHPANLSEAKAEARRAIDAWLNGRDPAGLQPADRPTLQQTLDAYHERADAPAREKEQFAPIASTVVGGRAFGEWPIADITREALEQFQQARPRVAGNRNLALLRAMYRWAVVGGLVEATPFKVGSVTVVRFRREAARSRRLQPGEAERLLLVSGGLADLIVAAIETGCRLGELRSMQWHQVRFAPRAEIFLPAQKTKAKRDRRIPISSVLRPILERRQKDPSGELLLPSAYVFGDEIGRKRGAIKTAWTNTLRRANLTDLHFHDLRREAGSRWMDAGVPLATIQRWLGHANVSQTSKYLGASLGGDEDDMRRFEERMGRVHPLTQPDLSSGSTGSDPTPSSTDAAEITQTNPIVPNPSGVVH